jgi:hypothetical protein
MIIEGYIELDNTITVSMNCLGKLFLIKIDGLDGFLATPRMFEGFYDDRKLGALQSPEVGVVEFISEFYWGSVYCWPQGVSEIRACKIIFPDINEEKFEDFGNRIVSNLDKWLNLPIDNVSFTMRGDYRGPRRAKSSKSSRVAGKFGLFRKLHGPDNYFRPLGGKPEIINVSVSEYNGFNEEELQNILNDTSNGKTPLLPFYFFFDAERAEFDENYRKSILDSATAVEVCFSSIIGKLLPTDNDLNKYIHSKHYTLQQKRELIKVLKVSLPFKEDDYKNKLDRLRNRVIHAGYIPSSNEVNSALKIAEQTLYSLLT